MTCKNCGLPKSAHIPTPAEFGRRKLWKCPDGSGSTYPATVDVQVELHYDAGEENPWVAKWVHPTAGPGEVVSKQPLEALEHAGREIEKISEERTKVATIGSQLK
jgi:hypothetical protein